ncbi:MAG: deoxyguanosinetriphosphate triphosphohydrolase [Fimbriimonadaceae bacterium]|nr:deoxyguanosinetriphosphate triphosphohydrolase [Alphaproteobacteria bacterium]
MPDAEVNSVDGSRRRSRSLHEMAATSILAGNLAPYASAPEHSRGRFVAEPESTTRSCFQRDRDRIIHSTAFRRLKHKTQVFVYHEGDHYRTRLTHSIEVSQIARSLARALALDEDLAEALALAHDLGHPPFGHAGERALCRVMEGYGGFDHNAQTLRIVTSLERRYAEFDGLNLTWETLEGLVKHNGPLTSGPDASHASIPHAITAFKQASELELWTYPSLEAQLAAIADDIAYDSHDIDDGVRAGLLHMDDLAGAPLIGRCMTDVTQKFPQLNPVRLIHESLRRLISMMVDDVIASTQEIIGDLRISSPDNVRQAGRSLAGFSRQLGADERDLKSFLRRRMYHHPNVIRVMEDAELVVADLFRAYFESPDEMPNEWRTEWDKLDERQRARRICDFVAGMTDRYALLEHQRLFDATPDLR